MPLKEINALSGLAHVCDGATCYTFSSTHNPSEPKLFYTCEEPQDGWLNRRRVGEMTPHGKKWWVPNIAEQVSPSVCSSATHFFAGASPCPGGGPCNFFLAEPQASPPAVNWNSLIHKCDEDQAPASLAIGTNPGGGWGVGDPPLPIDFNVAVRFGPLLTNGITVDLPSHGTFDAMYALQFAFSFGTNQPITWLGMGRTFHWSPETPPYDPTQGSCAGSATLLPKTRIPGPGYVVQVLVQSRSGGGNTFATPPGAFIVRWFDE